MGYAGKLREKRLAIKLRKQGYSYKEILEQVHVSKSTISLWCRDVIMSPKQLEKLREKRINGAEIGRLINAKKQQEKRVQKIKKILNDSKSEVGILTERERFMFGLGLYAGDGDKNDKSVGFANSRPEIIRFMMGWFREFCSVSEDRFRGRIWLHENLGNRRAINFWSRLTRIPETQFHKTYRASLKKSNKIRNNKHEYGVFAIRIYDSDLQIRIKSWMAAVLGDSFMEKR